MKIIKNLVFSILIIFILNNFVKSDIIDSDEINTLWWIGKQYYLAWDLTSNICIRNIGITCNNDQTHVIKLVIDNNISKGLTIGPDGTSISTSSGSSGSSRSSGSSGSSGSGSIATSYGTTSGNADGISTSYGTSSYGTSSSGTSSGTTSANADGVSTSYGTSSYGTSSGGTSTSYSSTNSFTTIDTPIPSSQETSPIVLTLEEYNGRSLLSTKVSSDPNPISNFYFPQLQSLIISIPIETQNINILEYIGNLDISYLEISSATEINSWPSTYLYNLPKLTSIKLKDLPLTTIPDSFLQKGFPLETLIIDFPVTYFPWIIAGTAFGIKNLYLDYNNGQSVVMDGYTWQYLENLHLKTSTGFSLGNFSRLRNVEYDCRDNVVSNYFSFESNDDMDSHVFKGCKFQFDYIESNVTNLSIFDSTISGTISTFNFPRSLEILEIERSVSYFQPSFYQLPNLKQLLLPYNTINTGFAKFDQLIKVNATTSNIPGIVPEEFCTIPNIELSKNSFTSVPDCFLCHWSVTSIWFTNNLNTLYPNGYQCTTASASKTTFEVLSAGETLEFSGQNLGWALSGSDSSLHVIIPNRQFKYDFPPKSQGITQKLIKFSNEVQINFQWSYYDLIISNVTFTQASDNLLLDIHGSFDSSSKVYLNNVQYTPFYRNGSIIQFKLSTSFQEGKVAVKIQSTLISTSFDSIYRRSFPVISSASIVPKSGGQATIYGSFYYYNKNSGSSSSSQEINPSPPVVPLVINDLNINNYGRSLLQITEDTQELKVYVNGKECQIIFSNSTIVIFSAPVLEKGGYANIIVENLNYNFTSTKVLYYEFINNECTEVCQNEGTCVSGSCKCIGDYYGPTCSFKKPPLNSYTLKADENKPSATYSFEKVDFEFSLQAIQEISAFNQVVKQINTTEWKPESIKIDTLGSATQYLSTETTGDVSIKVIVVVIEKSLTYEFAGVSMNLEPNQVKVIMNISNWDFESSLNTLRAVFISTSKSNRENDCEIDDQQVDSQADGSGLLSFSIKRSGAVLLGQFINRMLSNGIITYSQVEDLGVDSNGISYAGINIPHCQHCILDPNYASLLDPQFKSDNKCGNSRAWVIPVAVVIPIVAVCTLSVVGYIYLKKRFYITRDGKSIKMTRRGSKRNSRYGLDG